MRTGGSANSGVNYCMVVRSLHQSYLESLGFLQQLANPFGILAAIEQAIKSQSEITQQGQSNTKHMYGQSESAVDDQYVEQSDEDKATEQLLVDTFIREENLLITQL